MRVKYLMSKMKAKHVRVVLLLSVVWYTKHPSYCKDEVSGTDNTIVNEIFMLKDK